MAFNPFLSMGEQTAPVPSDALNPFAAPEVEIGEYSDDNPFSGSNPFSDFGGYEPPAGDTVPIDLFGTASPAVGNAMSAPPMKPVTLPLSPVIPPRPLTVETQNLILSVTGHMDMTSTHLLDRIPPTRTPSPVSVRDIQSPSLTPEPEPEMELAPPSVNKPARPPPARPPPVPRPPPPRPVVPPPRPAQPPAADDINLFDAPAPTVVKPTKEAILSLYSNPKKEEEKQIDFLSDDIPPAMNTTPMQLSENKNSNTINTSPFDIPLNEMDMSYNDNNESNSPFGNQTAINTEANEKESPFSQTEMRSNENYTFANDNNQEVESKLDSSPFQDAFQIDNNNSPFAETSPFTSDIGGVTEAAQITSFATNAGPFSSQDNNFETETSPFTSEPAAYTTERTQYESDDSPFATNVTPFTTDNGQFNTNSSPFTVNACSFVTDPSPFNSETVVHTNDSSPFTTAASPFDSNSVSTVVATGTASPFVEETYSTGAADTVFASPFAENEMVTKESSPFESVGSRRESEGNPFETETIAYDNSSEVAAAWGAPEPLAQKAFPSSDDTFDAFSAKFDNAVVNHIDNDVWGQANEASAGDGFEADGFDSFLSMRAPPPPPAATPHAPARSPDSGDDSFSLYIRPKEEIGEQGPVPILAPPPKPAPEAFRAAPAEPPTALPTAPAPVPQAGERDEDAPPTPLFDDDVSMPLEAFPRTQYTGPGWEMQLRQPNKKKITGQRFWKKIWVRLVYQGDSPVLQLLNSATDKEPFQELPLQPCYSVSEVGAQQFDQFGKIFTVKLQYVFYKERPGVRPGQVTKAERLTNKLSAFAAYAIQGDYQGVKEFGSDLRKLGLPVEHAPQVSQLFKIGSLNHEDVKQFSACVEEALFRLQAHRDRALTYKMEEVQITAVDELYVEQDAEGCVTKQIARVRIFFLGFLNGMPDVEVGVNDMRRQGREVVGRHDIIPVVTEEWIRVELPEFHACVQPEAFNETQLIRFKPPDACYIEVCRFRVRPPRNRELPLVLRAAWTVRGAKVELRADVLVAGFASRALGQVPCEDVAIRFPVPESWIYLFRVEKHFRYGSVKSAHRRTGKIKGIERFLGAVDTLSESLIEVTSGQAKYEHQHRAVVWRMPRLPKDGQGAYTTHKLVMRLALTSFDQIPAELAATAHVSFVMPAAQVSHVTIRSVALANHDADPPEKYVRYLARHEYIVGIERTSGESPAAAYEIAARPPPAAAPPVPAALPEPPSSDSDSD